MTPSAKSSVRFPAEWERHAATWLAWPHFRDDWPGKFEPIPWVYAEIIRNLARHEHVELIVNDALSEKRARKTLDRANALSDNVRFHRWPTNRVWTRDSGCTFVQCGAAALTRKAPEGRQKTQNREGHDFSRAVRPLENCRASAPAGPAILSITDELPQRREPAQCSDGIATAP
jgi:hypothetical protein